MKSEYQILHGDCLTQMKALAPESIDALVTDPPYGISFMGKKWDYDVPSVEVWVETLRLLKPGGHALVACGTRTQHRMAVNLEDAGFEIRDIVAWIYGSGFPKSRDIGKDIEKIKVGGIQNLTQIGTRKGLNNEDGTQGFSYQKEYVPGVSIGGEQINGQIPVYEITNAWKGFGTALKPAMELWTLCRKPLIGTVAENVLEHGTGGLNIDGCRIASDETITNHSRGSESAVSKGKYGDSSAQDTHQTNGQALGRFPANVIHDGSDEVEAEFAKSGERGGDTRTSKSTYDKGIWGNASAVESNALYNDSGTASRFFYTAKASPSERNRNLGGMPVSRPDERTETGMETFEEKGVQPQQNFHPTVKPIALMQYLCRLITPPNGLILDPFNGSGSTGIAAISENFNYIGIERELEYVEITKRRMSEIQTKLFV